MDLYLPELFPVYFNKRIGCMCASTAKVILFLVIALVGVTTLLLIPKDTYAAVCMGSGSKSYSTYSCEYGLDGLAYCDGTTHSPSYECKELWGGTCGYCFAVGQECTASGVVCDKRSRDGVGTPCGGNASWSDSGCYWYDPPTDTNYTCSSSYACDEDSNGSYTSYESCDAACNPPRDGYCGDGKTNGDEECDDGNSIDDDSCRNDCQRDDCNWTTDSVSCNSSASLGVNICGCEGTGPSHVDFKLMNVNGTAACSQTILEGTDPYIEVTYDASAHSNKWGWVKNAKIYWGHGPYQIFSDLGARYVGGGTRTINKSSPYPDYDPDGNNTYTINIHVETGFKTHADRDHLGCNINHWHYNITSTTVTILPGPPSCDSLDITYPVTPGSSQVYAGDSVELTGNAVRGQSPYTSFSFYSEGNSGSFNPVSGVNNTSVFTAPTTSGTYDVWFNVTDSDNVKAWSGTVPAECKASVVVVNPPVPECSSLTIGYPAAPGGNQVYASQTVDLNAVATSGSPPFQYQFYSEDNKGSFNPVSGANNTSVYTSPSAIGSYDVWFNVIDKYNVKAWETSDGVIPAFCKATVDVVHKLDDVRPNLASVNNTTGLIGNPGTNNHSQNSFNFSWGWSVDNTCAEAYCEPAVGRCISGSAENGGFACAPNSPYNWAILNMSTGTVVRDFDSSNWSSDEVSQDISCYNHIGDTFTANVYTSDARGNGRNNPPTESTSYTCKADTGNPFDPTVSADFIDDGGFGKIDFDWAWIGDTTCANCEPVVGYCDTDNKSSNNNNEVSCNNVPFDVMIERVEADGVKVPIMGTSGGLMGRETRYSVGCHGGNSGRTFKIAVSTFDARGNESTVITDTASCNNQSPTCSFTLPTDSQYDYDANYEVQAYVDDPDNDKLDYVWSASIGGFENAGNVAVNNYPSVQATLAQEYHTPATGGSVELTLNLTDSAGNTGSCTKAIDVDVPPDPQIIISLSPASITINKNDQLAPGDPISSSLIFAWEIQNTNSNGSASFSNNAQIVGVDNICTQSGVNCTFSTSSTLNNNSGVQDSQNVTISIPETTPVGSYIIQVDSTVDTASDSATASVAVAGGITCQAPTLNPPEPAGGYDVDTPITITGNAIGSGTLEYNDWGTTIGSWNPPPPNNTQVVNYVAPSAYGASDQVTYVVTNNTETTNPPCGITIKTKAAEPEPGSCTLSADIYSLKANEVTTITVDVMQNQGSLTYDWQNPVPNAGSFSSDQTNNVATWNAGSATPGDYKFNVTAIHGGPNIACNELTITVQPPAALPDPIVNGNVYFDYNNDGSPQGWCSTQMRYEVMDSYGALGRCAGPSGCTPANKHAVDCEIAGEPGYLAPEVDITAAKLTTNTGKVKWVASSSGYFVFGFTPNSNYVITGDIPGASGYDSSTLSGNAGGSGSSSYQYFRFYKAHVEPPQNDSPSCNSITPNEFTVARGGTFLFSAGATDPDSNLNGAGYEWKITDENGATLHETQTGNSLNWTAPDNEENNIRVDVTANDTEGLSDACPAITVNVTDDKPQCSTTSPGLDSEHQPNTNITFNANISDDDSNRLDYVWSASRGSNFIPISGSKDPTPATTLLTIFNYDLPIDADVSTEISLEVTDEHGNQDTCTQRITVKGPPNELFCTAISPNSITMGYNKNQDFVLTWNDPNAGDPAVFSWTVDGIAQGGANTDTFTYTSGGANDTGIQIVGTVSDGVNTVSCPAAVVDINDIINSPPVCGDILPLTQTVERNVIIPFSVTATDIDRDPISFKWNSVEGTLGPPKALGTPGVGTAYSSTFDWQAPNYEKNGINIDAVASDDFGSDICTRAVINVVDDLPPNNPPTCVITGSSTVDAGDPASYTVTGTDADTTDSLTVDWSASAGTEPPAINRTDVSMVQSGVDNTKHNATFNWNAPDVGQIVSMQATVTDSATATAICSMNVTVEDIVVNPPDTIDCTDVTPASTSLQIGTTGSFQAGLVYTGVGLITYDWELRDSSGTVISSANASGNLFTTPVMNATGSYTVSALADDGSISDSCTSATFSVVDSPPTCSITSPAAGTIFAVDTDVPFIARINDADGGKIDYAWDQSSGAGIAPKTGSQSAAAGSYSDVATTFTTSSMFDVTPNVWLDLIDDQENTGQCSLAISNESNTNATCGAVSGPNWLYRLTSGNFNVVANDAEGDPITYSWWASNGAIVPHGSSATWGAPNSTGSYTIGVSVTDGKNGSGYVACGSKFVTVINRPPTMSMSVTNGAVFDNSPPSPTYYMIPGEAMTIFGQGTDIDGAKNIRYTFSSGGPSIGTLFNTGPAAQPIPSVADFWTDYDIEGYRRSTQITALVKDDMDAPASRRILVESAPPSTITARARLDKVADAVCQDDGGPLDWVDITVSGEGTKTTQGLNNPVSFPDLNYSQNYITTAYRNQYEVCEPVSQQDTHKFTLAEFKSNGFTPINHQVTFILYEYPPIGWLVLDQGNYTTVSDNPSVPAHYENITPDGVELIEGGGSFIVSGDTTIRSAPSGPPVGSTAYHIGRYHNDLSIPTAAMIDTFIEIASDSGGAIHIASPNGIESDDFSSHVNASGDIAGGAEVLIVEGDLYIPATQTVINGNVLVRGNVYVESKGLSIVDDEIQINGLFYMTGSFRSNRDASTYVNNDFSYYKSESFDQFNGSKVYWHSVE